MSLFKHPKIKHSVFYNWIDNHADPHNILPPPIQDSEVIDILQEYLCEDYISVNPLSRKQYNTEWLYEVLNRYSSKFRREKRVYNKK